MTYVMGAVCRLADRLDGHERAHLTYADIQTAVLRVQGHPLLADTEILAMLKAMAAYNIDARAHA